MLLVVGNLGGGENAGGGMDTALQEERSYPRARALPGHALPGRLCLPTAALAEAEPPDPCVPGGAWEREGPRHKSRESQHEKILTNKLGNVALDIGPLG
jgi:hypothetical protein